MKPQQVKSQKHASPAMGRKKFSKERPTVFKKGYTPHNKGMKIRHVTPATPVYRRVSEDNFELLQDTDRRGNLLIRPKKVALEKRRVMLLRPKKEPCSKIARAVARGYTRDDARDDNLDDLVGYRIWLARDAVKACTKAQRDHDQEHPTCKALVRLSAKLERKVGLATSETFVCDKCKYKSKGKKFYDEIDKDAGQGCRRGRKVAVPNMAVQVALANSSIGVAAFRQFAAAMDLPVPVSSQMRKNARKYSDLMVRENERDMKAWSEKVKEMNSILGNAPDSPIKGEADSRYKSALYAGLGKKPGQPSPHAHSTFCEGVTARRLILAHFLAQKQCSTCQRQQLRRKRVRPGRVQKAKKHKCTANLKQHDVIGNEELAGREIGKKLLANKVLVSHILTDGDSHFAKGLSEVMMEARGKRTKPLRDFVHMGRSVAKAVRHGTWSKEMFPGNTAARRNKIKSRFAEELRVRLNAEHDSAVLKFGKRRQKMEAAMEDVMDAIPSCYMGTHDFCSTHSMVCNARRRWKTDRRYLPVKCLHPNSSDIKELRRIMEKRLGKKALESTRYCMDSNKAESVNRQSSKNVPKSGNWIETLPGRFSTTVHSSNNGPALSIVKRRAAAGIPLSPMSPTVKALESMERDRLYRRKYRNEPECKQRALANRIHGFKTYDELQEMGTYKSGNVPSAEKKRKVVTKVPRGKEDHTYNRMEGEGPTLDSDSPGWTDTSGDETD
ncbi:Hypp7504 [Branchiostoma lanceolatum]|uniref:Hypp7500 protein n=1 Tax=Branchiostoma lanceolatum TaxID=7740 RepID=A0A8K0EAV6_BRALA|nr:Hypp7500 [Branchiostoma lanceolatum]CAH1245536.1 Hypp7502 [Branchiostoma lanceolatum]CAH1245538.1 Hypp7504 [Branchiostoma lanceolatum]